MDDRKQKDFVEMEKGFGKGRWEGEEGKGNKKD